MMRRFLAPFLNELLAEVENDRGTRVQAEPAPKLGRNYQPSAHGDFGSIYRHGTLLDPALRPDFYLMSYGAKTATSGRHWTAVGAAGSAMRNRHAEFTSITRD
jgi:hypothetical protein